MSDSSWIIVGAGYTGGYVAAELCRRGLTVTVTRRELEAAQEVAQRCGCAHGVALDVCDVESFERLALAGATIVYSVPPVQGEGVAAFVRAAAVGGARRFIYLSTTGVYPRGRGEKTTEDTEEAPLGPRGEARLRAEKAARRAAADGDLELVVVRIAAIYGPGRGVAARLRAGTYRLIGGANSQVSRIHVEDLARAIIHVGELDPLEYSTFNAADDESTTSRFFAERAAAALGVSPPPETPLDEVSVEVRAMLTADRSIDNHRLKATGFTFRYPTWREGLAHVCGAAEE